MSFSMHWHRRSLPHLPDSPRIGLELTQHCAPGCDKQPERDDPHQDAQLIANPKRTQTHQPCSLYDPEREPLCASVPGCARRSGCWSAICVSSPSLRSVLTLVLAPEPNGLFEAREVLLGARAWVCRVARRCMIARVSRPSLWLKPSTLSSIPVRPSGHTCAAHACSGTRSQSSENCPAAHLHGTRLRLFTLSGEQLLCSTHLHGPNGSSPKLPQTSYGALYEPLRYRWHAGGICTRSPLRWDR